MKLRGALYGCGMISEFHLRGWARIPEVEIVAIGNRTLERAEQRRSQFAPHARLYCDIAAMLASERPDFLDILTPPALHREHIRVAQQAGVHIICQKPLAGTTHDARAIAADLTGYPRICAVHENHRYRPWFQRALAHMPGGLTFASFQHLNATSPKETYKQSAETGVLLEYGSHLVDMMRSVLGEPERVYARTHRINPNIRGETLVHAVYEYPHATAIVEAGWKDSAITQSSVLLAGDQCEAFYQGTLTRGGQGRLRLTQHRDVVVDETLDPAESYADSFYLLQRECADAMLGRRTGTTQSVAEHMKTLECTFAAYASAAHGEIIELK
jgi:predicted dehydrogenase